MKKFLCGSTAIALTCGLATGGLAQTIVDTGEAQQYGGYYLDGSQSLAGKFTLASTTTIGSVEGWIGGDISANVTVSIFSDSGVPGTALFSDTLSTTIGIGAWQGVFGENWTLGPGTYWATFSSSDYSSFMGAGAPNPLSDYAFTSNGAWFEQAGLNFGVRIEGAAPAPEPACWALMLSGFGMVGGALRSRRRTAVSFG